MAGPLGRFSLLASALAGLLLVVAFASIVQAAEPRWSRVTSPARTFTVELPQDWIIKPTEPDESTVAFMPSGRDLPCIRIHNKLDVVYARRGDRALLQFRDRDQERARTQE